MNISGLDKAEVLAALFNASRQIGMGLFDNRGDSAMSIETARLIVAEQTDFDYLYGRVMKLSLDGEYLDTGLYNRDNGDGAAERALASLLTAKSAV